nr:ALTOa [JC polyomavirus]
MFFFRCQPMEQMNGNPGGIHLMRSGMKTCFAMKKCLPVMMKTQDPNTLPHLKRKKR